jgi:hypothetical protein
MAKGFKHGGGGGSDLNFRVLVGTAAPSSPKENDIWVNTDVKVDGWHFGTDEPNVRDVKPMAANDPHQLIAPYKLSEGDLLSFVIPETVTGIFEAIRIYDPNTNKAYCVRSWAGASAEAWPAGMKVSLRISNDLWPINVWSKDGTAYITGWGSFYHEEGEVWITTGTQSGVAFNALKKNSVQVYPISAKQYVSGAWKDVTAKSYQRGQWVEWFTYLLQSGAFEIAAAEYLHNTSTQSETKGDGYIEFSSTSSSGTDKTIVRGRRTEAAVDLTGIDTIYAKVNVTSAVNETNTAGATLAILTGTTQSTKVAATEARAIGEGLMALDVSQYSGSYYIMFGAFAYRGSSGSPTGTVRFYDVYW